MNIAVASGKGGTGKTLISTNLFRAMQKEGIPVTLIDCDAEEPNVKEFIRGVVSAECTVSQQIPVINTEECVFCGRCHDYCSYHAIVYLPTAGFIKVVEELCHDCGACYFACQNGAVIHKERTLGKVETIYINCNSRIIESRSEIGIYSPVPVIKKGIKEADGRMLNIFDSPPGISCPFIAAVIKSDYVVLVTEPTPFGLNNLKLSVDTLRQLGKPFGVVVNRAKLGNNEVYQYLKQNGIPLLMKIPMDREIARICSEGLILVDEEPHYQLKFYRLYKTIYELRHKTNN